MLKTYELRVNYHIVDVKVSQLPAYMEQGLRTPTFSLSQAYCTRQTDRMEAGPRLRGR